MRDARRLAGLIVAAAVGGLLLGWLTAGFFWAIDELIALVWTDLPGALGVPTAWYALVVCSVGGLLVGLGQRFLGDHPPPLSELLSHEEGTRGFDLRVLPHAVYLLVVSLAFGGALGPELGLVFLSGTIGIALAGLLRRAEAAAIARDIAIAAVFATLFVSPLGGAATAAEDAGDTTLPRIQRVLLALSAGLAAIAAFAMVPTPGLVVDVNWPASGSTGPATDVLWAVPLGLLGAAIGLLYQRVHSLFDLVRGRIGGAVLPAIGAGVVLGALGSWDSLVLFSGQDGIEELVNSLSTRSAWELALLAAVKLLLIALLLAAGWKGGHFYPMLFVATAAGLCISRFAGAISPVVAVAAVSAGVLAAVLRRVVAAAFLVLLMVPASMLVVSSVAAVVAFLALRLTVEPARLREQPGGR